MRYLDETNWYFFAQVVLSRCLIMFKKLKSLEILERPELTFKHQLSKNPYYPFEKTDEKHFEIMLNDRRFYYGSFATIVVLLCTIIYVIVEGPGQYLVFSIIVTIVCTTMAWENRGHRKCILDSEINEYICYENGHVTYSGTYNNIYIRLKEQKYGSGSVYYYVVFNGYHMHEQKLTSYSTNRKRLRSLARKLATALNLNYFDSKTISLDHLVRHQRPQPPQDESVHPNTSSSCNIATSPV